MVALRSFARHLGTASLAGILTGFFVAGMLGRLAMRVSGLTSRPELIGTSTANGNVVGEVTFGGSMALAVFSGLGAGIAGGVLYASAEPWLRRRRAGGLAFGIALLLALGFTVIDATNFDFQRFGPHALNVAMFALLFPAYGVIVAWLFGLIRGTIDRSGPVATATQMAVWLAAVAAPVLSVPTFFSAGGVDEFFVAVMLALLVPALVRWRAMPSAIAYAAFAAPILIGAMRLARELRTMLGI